VGGSLKQGAKFTGCVAMGQGSALFHAFPPAGEHRGCAKAARCDSLFVLGILAARGQKPRKPSREISRPS
jgi:hypothetical protein